MLGLPPEIVNSAALVVASAAGAFVGGRMSRRNDERAMAASLRRQAADACVLAISAVRDALTRAETERDPRDWSRILSDALDTVDDARDCLPGGMRHLHRGVRDATGEAVGAVSMVRLRPLDGAPELAPFDREWTILAVQYLDYVVLQLRRVGDVPLSGGVSQQRAGSASVIMPQRVRGSRPPLFRR